MINITTTDSSIEIINDEHYPILLPLNAVLIREIPNGLAFCFVRDWNKIIASGNFEDIVINEVAITKENYKEEIGSFFGNPSGSTAIWGQISGDLEDQEDLYNAIKEVNTGKLFTGTELNLTHCAGMYQVATANTATTYTVASNPILGSWCKVLINATTEPTVTGATKIKGSTFIPSTNMYLLASYNGTRIEYYFAEI